MIRRVTIQAPAKLNLGLEVIDRRPDGFHEIVTLFQAISIYDNLELSTARDLPDLSLTSTDPDLDDGHNLVLRALEALRQAAAVELGASAALTKRIPVAAGLGGASSDAAAALRAGRELWQLPLSDGQLRELARTIGSDVPFFLDAGTALGTGRGDEITPLSPLSNVWFVVVSPRITIPQKTSTLYAALRRGNFSSGASVRHLAANLDALARGAGQILPPNAFSRPLYELRPDLATLPERMHAAGAQAVSLSGAGPSHYALFPDFDQAQHVATKLQTELGATAEVCIAGPVVKPRAPVSTYHG